jgi:diacylglycerol kinase family enzyme
MHFIESVGFGLVASGIHEAAGRIPKGDPEVHLEEARQFYIDLLDRSDATPYTIALDGDTISGNYVLIEALNAPMIGPRINLTAHASIADGLLSIVAVANADRARLRAYFEALRGGSTADAGFTSWRAPRLEIGGASRMHIDDRVVDVDGPVRISIAPAALPVLV